MDKLSSTDLLTLEAYSKQRPEFRREVMAHKANRKIHLGEHATLYFEDRLTIQYQIQEMLRIERIFESKEIQSELDAYNPLIPDGRNWKATFMLEYPDAEQRRAVLATLIGIEDRVWVQVDGKDRVWATADEDLERETEEKTSSVHFLRFELTDDMVGKLKGGADLGMGIEHDNYYAAVQPVPEPIKQALVQDLD